ncbi:MAG: hydrogenase maturation protease [Acidimicrobiia bacterium]
MTVDTWGHPTPRVLVAGLGNIFFGDDAFGSEVARRLLTDGEAVPEGVKVTDFGIRGIHLAYELLDGYDTAILVDATPQGGDPGTVYVIEPDLDALESESGLSEAGIADAHGMDPVSVLTLFRSLGGGVGRLLVVGCEPADTDEHMGLSAPVADAVDEAVRVIRDLVTPEPGEKNTEHSERKETPG